MKAFAILLSSTVKCMKSSAESLSGTHECMKHLVKGDSEITEGMKLFAELLYAVPICEKSCAKVLSLTLNTLEIIDKPIQ